MSELNNPEDTINDPGILQLREQTKNVMIPLLIKVFQMRLEAQQLSAPPSRLTVTKSNSSLEDLAKKLTTLNEDLKKQELWIQSSRVQIEKVLSELKEPTHSLEAHIKTVSENPAIGNSFRKAIQKSEAKSSSTFSWLKELLRIN